MSGAFANLNELWSRVIVETLRRKGVRYAIVCPGSRSSPLACAFARERRIEAISILDERSAGFFALGLSKREGIPTALVCTSGTAAANFFPAVIEASESGVPLIVLTADRPQELRQCRAGQTIDQFKLYGNYPVSQTELALPESSRSMLRYLRQEVATHCDRSLTPRSGPAHLNIPFREPLAPIADGSFETPLIESEWSAFFDHMQRSEPLRVELDSRPFTEGSRGIVIIGSPLKPISESWIENVSAFCRALKWPVLADGLNPIRNHSNQFDYLITGYDAICRSTLIDERLAPEKVVVIGDLPISKTLRAWLTRAELPSLFLNANFREGDATRGRSQGRYFDFNYAVPKVDEHSDDAFAQSWVDVDRQVRDSLRERMESCEHLFEGKVVAELSKQAAKHSALFVSNSLPPRDMEWFWGASDSGIDVYSSRGASGIDGILSTALGIAHKGKATYLLTGDLALLHDTNGALAIRHFSGELTIILVNNEGGGIFEMLPVASMAETFESFFATPQRIDFRHWAATYDIEFERATDWESFSTCLSRNSDNSVRLIEVVTDRKADAATRRDWFEAIAARLD